MSKVEIVREYLSRFPDTPDLTLAKKIYKENSKIFSSIESVRTTVRSQRGKKPPSGRSKKLLKDKTFFKPKTYDTNPFKLPESYADSFEHYRISQSKSLIIGDLHFPYQDNKAITAALKYGLERKANLV